jgi:monoamine oxidase
MRDRRLTDQEGTPMARTPLLRAFQKLAEEHRTAERIGISPAELRGRRDDAVYSRGEFLKRAGVLGAGVAAGPLAFSSGAKAATPARIAIVGGGIAGLSAAMTLVDKGVVPTVYEASPDRLGGRMHSDRSGYWADHQVSEFCGELIDSGHKTILHLAQRFNLATSDLFGAQPNGSTDTLWFLGGYYSTDQADRDFQPIHNILQGQVQSTSYPTTYLVHTDAGVTYDNMSVYDWIENYVPGKHGSAMGRMLDAAYNEEYGAETRDQAALNLMYLLGYKAVPGNFSIFGASDERYHIDGGNEQLPEAIATYIGRANVKQGWAMQSINANADGTVTMSFTTPGKTQTVTADHVILCMSFSVLRTLDYSGANFDSLKKTAITKLGSGRNSKLQLQFKNRLWNTQGPWGLSNGNVYTDIGIQNIWDVSRGQAGASGLLVNYSGGNVAGGYKPSTPYSNAATNAQVTTYANSFLAKLENVFPGITKQWTGKATLSTPFLDPLLNCSYSYWRVGQYVGFSGYEGARQGNIHFAGEHCSQDFQGYMEGGAAEGIRAANEILAAP